MVFLINLSEHGLPFHLCPSMEERSPINPKSPIAHQPPKPDRPLHPKSAIAHQPQKGDRPSRHFPQLQNKLGST